MSYICDKTGRVVPAPWRQLHVLIRDPYDDEERWKAEEKSSEPLHNSVLLGRRHTTSCERLVLGDCKTVNMLPS